MMMPFGIKIMATDARHAAQTVNPTSVGVAQRGTMIGYQCESEATRDEFFKANNQIELLPHG